MDPESIILSSRPDVNPAGCAPLLAIPPFPGAKVGHFAVPADAQPVDVDAVTSALARHRVGGRYWGPRPEILPSSFVLDGTGSPLPSAMQWDERIDPWHLLRHADHVRLPAGDCRGVLAISSGRPLTIVAADGSERRGEDQLEALVAKSLSCWRWRNPFNGGNLSLLEAIEICGFWRRLIDSNRGVATVLGIADWKKPTVAPLLWDGTHVPFDAPLPSGEASGRIAVWRSRLSAAERTAIDQNPAEQIEIEDGFIRSTGLGANCVPPQSIVVDRLGVHFDPTTVSDLEQLIETACFPAEMLERAARLRNRIVREGVSKYGSTSHHALQPPVRGQSIVLVVGQVEDDRAVTSGLALSSNLELLRRARAEAGSDAYVIYKPHPDVVAGHRRGDIAPREVDALADLVEATAPIANLIALADAIHVNTSLAGFEALLRGKPVVVHGMPFYAGWGLTTDRAAVPPRRTAVRTVDELVAACLITYPRYVDPKTGLPCSVEVLLDRIAEGDLPLPFRARTLVWFRKMLGRSSRLFLPRR